MKFYGDKFKALKKLKKITSTKLAEQLGTTRKTIHSWETGRSTPKFSDIKLICEILDIQPGAISNIQENNTDNESIDELAAKGKSSKELKQLRDLIKSNNIPDSNIEYFVNLYRQASFNSNENIRLKNKLNRFERILNNIDPIIYIKNSSHKYTYINNSFLNIINPDFSSEEVIGTTHNDLFDRLEYIPLLTIEKKVFKYGKSVSNLKITLPNTNGTQTGLLNITPSYDTKNHDVREIVVTIKDITELSVSIAKQEQFKEIINSMDECVFIRNTADPDLGYSFISKSAEIIYGYKAEEFYNDPNLWFKVILDEDKSKLTTSSSSNNLKSGDWQYRIRSKDGEIKWIYNNMFSIKDSRGDDVIFGLVKDMTKSKLIEKELFNLYNAVQASDLVLWSGDIEQMDKSFEPKLFYIGDNIHKYFEIGKDKIIHDSLIWLKHIHPDDISKAQNYLKATNYPKTITLRLNVKNSGYQWINLRAVLIDNIRYGVAKNVTEIVELYAMHETMHRIFLNSSNPCCITEYYLENNLNKLKIISANDAIKKLFVNDFELIAENPLLWRDYLHPEDKEKVIDKISRITEKGIRQEYRLIINEQVYFVLDSSFISYIANKKYMASMLKIEKITPLM